jgi:hypothetical protein
MLRNKGKVKRIAISDMKYLLYYTKLNKLWKSVNRAIGTSGPPCLEVPLMSAVVSYEQKLAYRPVN